MAAPPRVRLPSLLQGAAFALDVVRFLEWCRDRYGDVFEVRLPGMGRFVYISDPALVKQVFAADRDIGLAGEARRPFFEPLLGTQSLLTTDGEQWERQRKLIGPPFHGELIENYRDQIHAIAVADIESWPRGMPMPLRPRMQAITLEVILRLIFGIEDAARLERLRSLLPRLTNEGACNADRRHLFNLSSVLISPGIGPGLVNLITKDWQIGLIYQARSGSPLTPGVTGDLALTGGTQRAVIVPGVDPNLKPEDRVWIPNAAGINTRMQWFNMAAFANNSPGVWGNVARNSLVGPKWVNTDLAFSRNINMAHGRRVEIRIEAFNLFDTVNWANPNVTVDNQNAGQVTNTTGDPRIMQFALKYQF